MYLLFLALLPGIFLLGLVYGHDKVEKEPTGLLLKLFLLGVLSTIPACIIEVVFDSIAKSNFAWSAIAYLLVKCYLIIAIAEEGCKYFFLKTSTWNSPEFNYTFDGVVYAVTVSLGFATLENILYVFKTGALGVALMRAIFSVPGHAMFAVYMGIYYGIAKLSESYMDTAGRDKNLMRGLLIAILFHGTFDFCLMTGQIIIIICFLIGELILTFKTYKKLKIVAGADRRIR